MSLTDSLKKTIQGHIDEILEKAEVNVVEAIHAPKEQEIGRKSHITDPFYEQVAHQSVYKPKFTRITNKTLKEVSIRDWLVSTIIQNRCDSLLLYTRPAKNKFERGYGFRRKDQRPLHSHDLDKIRKYESLVYHCGNTEGTPASDRYTFGDFCKMTVRDALTFGHISVEKVLTRIGHIHRFRPIPAEQVFLVDPNATKSQIENTIRGGAGRFQKVTDNNDKADQQFNLAEINKYKYVQVGFDGIPMEVFGDEDMVFKLFNPQNFADGLGYCAGLVELAISSIANHMNVDKYNVSFFTNGYAARGVLHLKGVVQQSALAAFRRQFHNSITGTAHCLGGNSVIFTKNGAFSIEEFLGAEKEKEAEVWTGNGWSRSTVFRVDEHKRKSSLTLSNGLSIISSPDHKFRAIDSTGDFVWIKQQDLQIGSFVAVNAKPIDGSIVPEYKTKPITPELMEVLGWMTGDGYFACRKKINTIKLFYHHEKELQIRERHLSILKEFGLNARKKDQLISDDQVERIKLRHGFKNVSKVRATINLNSADFCRWLISLGFSTSSNKKTIPPFLYSSPEEHRSAFLRGYFSADGSNLNRRNPRIAIADKNLRNKTRLLLSSIGIRTNLTEGKTKTTFINGKQQKIYGQSFLLIKDRDVFFQKVNFLQPHKQGVIFKKINELGKSDRLPFSTIIKFARQIREINRNNNKLTKRERMDLNSILAQEDGCSRKRLCRFAEKVGLNLPRWIYEFNFESVVEIERTDELVQMYDLTVHNDEHLFIANGIAVSNSHRTPIIAGLDDVQWIPISASSRDMEYIQYNDQVLRTVCSQFQIDPAEIGLEYLGHSTGKTPLQESNNEYKLEASKERGFRPILMFYEDFVNNDILPLFDPDFSREFQFFFCGYDDTTPMTEVTLMQAEQSVHASMNDLLRKAGKPEIDEQIAKVPLNSTFWALVEKNYTRGEIREKFFGDAGASQRKELSYIPGDPMYIQNQNMLISLAGQREQERQAIEQKAREEEEVAQQAMQAQQMGFPPEDQGEEGSPGDESGEVPVSPEEKEGHERALQEYIDKRRQR